MQKEKTMNPLVKSFIESNALDKLENDIMPFKQLMAYYKCAIMEVETKFNVLNEEFSLHYDRNPIETIKTRLKSADGIAKKLARKNIPISVETIEEHITDVAGVRVVCAFLEDIYFLEECLLKQDDIKLIRVKDYIKNPKESGYRSLHLIIEIPIFLKDQKKNMKVEVQFRTIAMDFWASLEHKLRYKKDVPKKEAALLATELIECANISADLDRRMEDIKNKIINL